MAATTGAGFQKRVGEALIKRNDLYEDYPDWGDGSSADHDLRLKELKLEQQVSDYLCELPFL